MPLQLNTKTKIALARVAYHGLMALRRPFGLDHTVDTQRDGVRWRLDLREGIDLAIYLLGRFEPETVQAYRRLIKPGDLVLDIGANIGAHTLHLAKAAMGGKVVAFEPTAYAYAKLLANIALNPQLAPIIQPEQMMLVENSSTAAPAAIYSSWPLSTPTGTPHPKHLGVPMDTRGVRTSTLDDYLESAGVAPVRFIKLDVDGNESTVLRGAHKMLRRDKPVLLMEMMPYGLTETGSSFEELLALLNAAGYRLYRLNGSPLPSDSSLAQHIPPAGNINVVCRAA
jgi:FkbM family methyltransferase